MDDSDTLQVNNPPQQILIGNSAENDIFDAVVQTNAGMEKNAWGSAPIGEKSSPQWVWFVVGLILFPIVVGIISASLAFMSELQTENSSSEAQKMEDIQLGGETFSHHKFSMPSHF